MEILIVKFALVATTPNKPKVGNLSWKILQTRNNLDGLMIRQNQLKPGYRNLQRMQEIKSLFKGQDARIRRIQNYLNILPEQRDSDLRDIFMKGRKLQG
ncbi:hypothetical protein MTR_1g052610 [Medicago truncatula]|uniref:Uncharacterized protein n=1 Tax=Medicago truncatula TaxID=3880 RepID=A0A072VTZ5_MEDTR|nr:hypothetical protein MTR_1g052610 [Medicago truncatula]